MDTYQKKQRKKERKKNKQTMEKTDTKFGGEKSQRAKEMEKKEKHQIGHVGQRVIWFLFFIFPFKQFIFLFCV